MSTPTQIIDKLADRFREAWKGGLRPRIEDSLGQFDREHGASLRSGALQALLDVELACRRKAGENPMPEEYYERFPDCRADIDAVFAPPDDAPEAPCPPAPRRRARWPNKSGNWPSRCAG